MRSLIGFVVLATSACAQVPDGSYVVSSFRRPSTPSSAGGVFLVDPRTPGPAVALTGLAPELIGAVGASTSSGANAVAVTDESFLYVGPVGPPGTAIDLHVIFPAAGAAAPIGRSFVGTVRAGTSFGGGISQIQALPNGDAVFSVGELESTPPLNGSLIGYYTAATGAISPISAPVSETFAQSVAIDPERGFLYFTTSPGLPDL